MHSQTNFERKALERELIHHCEGSELAFGKALYYWERGDRSLANQALKDGAAALDALDSKIQESLQKTGWFGRGPTRAQSLGVDLESSQQYLRAAREVTPLYEKIVSGQGVEVSQILESWQQSPMAKQHHTAQGHVNGVRSLPQNVLILSPSSTPFESNAFSVGVAEKVITAHGQALLGCLALERNDDDAMRFHSDVLQAIIERGTIGPLSTDSTRRAFAPALNTVTAHIPRPPRETISLRGHFLEHPEQTLSLIERALLKEDQIVVIEEKLFELGRTLANHSSQTLIEDYVRVATLYGLYHSTSDRTVQTHNDNTLKFITYVENRFPNSEIIPLAKCALLYRQNPEAENSGPILLALRQGINRQTGAVAILSAMQVLQHAQGLKEVAPTARADLAVNILNRTKECPDSRGAHATRAAQSEAKEILISNATTEEQLRVAIGVLDDRLIQGKLFFDGIGNKPSQAREHRLREQVFYDSDRLLILARKLRDQTKIDQALEFIEKYFPDKIDVHFAHDYISKLVGKKETEKAEQFLKQQMERSLSREDGTDLGGYILFKIELAKLQPHLNHPEKEMQILAECQTLLDDAPATEFLEARRHLSATRAFFFREHQNWPAALEEFQRLDELIEATDVLKKVKIRIYELEMKAELSNSIEELKDLERSAIQLESRIDSAAPGERQNFKAYVNLRTVILKLRSDLGDTLTDQELSDYQNLIETLKKYEPDSDEPF